MAEYSNLKAFVDADGNIIDCAALKFIRVTSKGNVEIMSPEGAKINFESGDNEVHKPVSKIQLDTNHYTLDDDKKKVKIAFICDKGSKVQGANLECAGIDIETSSADESRGWKKQQFRLRIKGQNQSDDFGDLNIHARSIDLRARATGVGTGGGIATQIASCDSNLHENKFKIETDRIRKVEDGLPSTAEEYSQFYCGEGGKGIEIGTVNSQFTSLFTRSYRFKSDAPIYAVTRGELVTDPETGKVDYPTQADDSKDIISDDAPITWADLIATVKYFKTLNQGGANDSTSV